VSTAPEGFQAKAAKRILLIDDSEMVLAVTSAALLEAGFEVRAVLYPHKIKGTLVQEVVEFEPDLILSDVEMPMLSGDVFAKLAKASPMTRTTRLYFYSALPEERLRQHVKDTKADGFLQKSPDKAALVHRVRQIVG